MSDRLVDVTARMTPGYAEVIHLAVLSPYTANLCPLCVWFELAGFRKDFGESIGELIETMLGSAFR